MAEVVYEEFAFSPAALWTMLPKTTVEEAADEVVTRWGVTGWSRRLKWDQPKLKQAALWKLQVWHKRERSHWLQEEPDLKIREATAVCALLDLSAPKPIDPVKDAASKNDTNQVSSYTNTD